MQESSQKKNLQRRKSSYWEFNDKADPERVSLIMKKYFSNGTLKFVMEIENFKYILCRFYCIIFSMFVNKKVNENK